MNRIIAVLLSFITAFFPYVSANIENIFGTAYIENIKENDIEKLDNYSGFLKNTVLVFFDEDADFSDKINTLSSYDLRTVCILSDFNLHVAKTKDKSFEELNKLCESLNNDENVALSTICPARKIELQYTPDDPFNDELDYWNYDWDDENPEGNNWHLEATETRASWGYNPLYENINIGVVDGGFDTDHEELAGKIYFPTKRAERRNKPNHHGTHVAGIIGAWQDNGVGISGICPDSTLICVDWSPSDGQLWIPDLAVLQALSETVKGGAKVINFSVGSSSSIGAEDYEFPKIVMDIDGILYSYAMGSLLNKGYDFLVVQSAGNGNEEAYAVDATQNGLFCAINEKNAFLPFRNVTVEDLLDRIIVVANAEITEGGYALSSSSNVGDRVDIAAPGYEIFSCTKDDTYGRKTGTSMAAPVVTGIASLVWSVNEDLTAPEVKKIICENTNVTVSPAEERYFENLNYKSYNMVNAKLSVEAALRLKEKFFDVSLVTDMKQEVVFTNENGDEFIFETKSDGTLTCVLETGNYTLITETETKEITINENCEITA